MKLVDKMIRYGLARSRSHAFNIMIEKGLNSVLREVKFWDHMYKKGEEFEREGLRIRHGELSKLLEEGRSR